MASVSAQEYQSVFSELQCLKEKFVSLEQENQRLLGDLQQLALKKQQTQQQHGELALRVQQLKAAVMKKTVQEWNWGTKAWEPALHARARQVVHRGELGT